MRASIAADKDIAVISIGGDNFLGEHGTLLKLIGASHKIGQNFMGLG
jgi:hypothetical protein